MIQLVLLLVVLVQSVRIFGWAHGLTLFAALWLLMPYQPQIPGRWSR